MKSKKSQKRKIDVTQILVSLIADQFGVIIEKEIKRDEKQNEQDWHMDRSA